MNLGDSDLYDLIIDAIEFLHQFEYYIRHPCQIKKYPYKETERLLELREKLEELTESYK